MTGLFTAFPEIPQASSRNSNEPLQTSPPARFQCYCTAIMARARFMSNGWKHVPCDGSACAYRRQEQEQLLTLPQSQLLS